MSECFGKTGIEFLIFLSNNNVDVKLRSSIDALGFQYKANVVHPPFLSNGNEHLIWMIENIHVSADWYWLFGDDDEVGFSALIELEYLLSLQTIDYIHATDAKVTLTKETEFGQLKALAKKYGILELFSFWSSQILSQSTLLQIREYLKLPHLRSIFFERNHPSASFAVSVLMLAAAKDRPGAIMKSPAVHSSHTPSEVPSGDISFWFHLHRHFSFLTSLGLLEERENRDIFLHHKQPIWNKQTMWLLAPLLRGQRVFVSHYFAEVIQIFKSVGSDKLVRSEALLVNLSAEISKSIELNSDKASRHSLLRQLHLIYSHLASN